MRHDELDDWVRARLRWPERVSRPRAAAHGSGELAWSEESEREGKKGSESSLATLRNTGAVNLSRRSSGMADRRWHRAFGLQMAALAARVLREAAAGRGGVQDGSGGA